MKCAIGGAFGIFELAAAEEASAPPFPLSVFYAFPFLPPGGGPFGAPPGFAIVGGGPLGGPPTLVAILLKVYYLTIPSAPICSY